MSVSNKKALIVSPYLDHLGGGERYMLSAASVLESLGYQVTFAWDNLAEINQLAQKLGIKLQNPELAPQIKPLYFDRRPWAMYLATRTYDLVFYLSDGSLPMLGSRRNLVHMQVPFHGVHGMSWQNQLKKRFIDQVIVNSRFTKQIVDREFGVRSLVIYPPVPAFTAQGTKKNLILSVGRFEPSLNAKKQNILLDAFAQLSPKLPGWELVLAGASVSDDWVNRLRVQAVGLPVRLAVDCTFTGLQDLYHQAKIYWHAAGYGVDETKNPELTEHFGISTVEAISAGCLPLVIPYGGQREIVTDPNFQWETVDELIAKTLALVKHPAVPDFDIARFSVANFISQLDNILA